VDGLKSVKILDHEASSLVKTFIYASYANDILMRAVWFSWCDTFHRAWIIYEHKSALFKLPWFRLHLLLTIWSGIRVGKFCWWGHDMRDRYKVFRHILKVQTSGPQFSSDIAGDGPGSDKSARWSELPAYNPDQYQRWSKNFMSMLPNDLDEVLSGDEPEFLPEVHNNLMAGNFTGQALLDAQEADAAYSKSFKKRNKLCFQAIMASITKNGDGSKQDLGVSLLDTYDGVAAWQTLKQFHMDKSNQNKFNAVIEMLKLCQLRTETALEFKVRLEAAFRKIEDLEVKSSDLKLICFLNGLVPRYSSRVNTLSVPTTTFTLDDVLKQLNSFDVREHTDQGSVKAN
jgi:hypothetical protein